ncbi:methyl-CpG-binding domain-containing protein 9-like [Dorcoceras hygrometricum]|uniref:Methyl-CpG-binding domain-containing protein 9-like n=1 Tax=Dorcoceras hygrometricum TaxID=472368 RepID=A0A2Z7B1E9_9LAMI|nr:methyl-CpG-binding domain-containing protein 9-like [Dorcoceras hygrometricum]
MLTIVLDKDLECTIVYVRCDSGYDGYHETHLMVTVYSELVPSRLGRQNEDKASKSLRLASAIRSTMFHCLKCRFPRETGRSQAPRRQQGNFCFSAAPREMGSGSATVFQQQQLRVPQLANHSLQKWYRMIELRKRSPTLPRTHQQQIQPSDATKPAAEISNNANQNDVVEHYLRLVLNQKLDNQTTGLNIAGNLQKLVPAATYKTQRCN